jgi:glycosyltransferase involved in cell wall biosynthesis
MPTIAYDLRYATDHFPGIGRHTFCLLESLLELPGPERYLVLWNPALQLTRFDLEPIRKHPRVTMVERPISPLAPISVLALGAFLRETKPDLYFSPFHFMPFSPGCPCVVMVHDVWPLRFRYALSAWKRVLYRLSLGQTAHARLIVTPSRFSRDEMVELLGFDASRIRVVRQGAPAPRQQVAARRPEALPDRPFALTVGLNYPYKNLGVLVDAWAKLGEASPLEWVAAGRSLDRYPTVSGMARERGASRITELGQVTENELEWLYQNATLLLFPTIYEGFGFPLVEAFQRGLPVIASNIPSLRELDAGATRFVSAQDPAEWAAAVVELANDAAARERMSERGRIRAGELTYDLTARTMLAVLREALTRGDQGTIALAATEAAPS